MTLGWPSLTRTLLVSCAYTVIPACADDDERTAPDHETDAALGVRADSGRDAGAAAADAVVPHHDLDADRVMLDASTRLDASLALDSASQVEDDASARRDAMNVRLPDGALDFSGFDEAFEASRASLDELGTPLDALAVVVTPQDGIIHQRVHGRFTLDRVFVLGGASSLISAGVLMRLVDQGLLTLDGPISSALASWGEHKRGLTLAQLLSNSAGLPSIDNLRSAEQDEVVAPQYAAHRCQRSEAGTLEACARSIYADDTPANNLPADTQFSLGGSAWHLAGAIAEQVSGKSWQQLVQETYALPCGTQSLGYTNQYQRFPIDYPAFEGNAEALPRTQNPSIEGGAYVSARDYATVLRMHLRGGTCGDQRVLSASSVERMQVNRIAQWGGVTGSPVSPGYGLGWYSNDRSRVISAPGAYGFYPLIDRRRGYGLIVAVEADVIVAVQLVLSVKQVLDQLFPIVND